VPGSATDPSRVLIIRVAYDGTGFSGYAKQPSLRTVEGVLEEALRTVLRPEAFLDMAVAGRTDAGVHALGQVISVATTSSLDIAAIERSLAKLLPDDISATVEEGPTGFDARRSALSRRYRYRLSTSPHRDPLRRSRVWWVGPLSPVALQTLGRAAELLIGTHDFRGFCKNPDAAMSTERYVESAEWFETACSCDYCADELWFEIEANAFCHEMVRRLVGAMVHWAISGEKPVSPEEVTTYRWKPAPPQGLYLLGVRYPPAKV
jgi:tRNA pseudouridine38-40 synthase